MDTLFWSVPLGIWVSEDKLKQATVTSVHYCINILFPSESEARHFLSCLSKMSLGKKYENNDREYANDGKTVRFYNKTFEWVAYMKYYDVLEVGRNQVSKKATAQEREIVMKLSKEKHIPPLIRIEIRFKGMPSIRKHFKIIFGEDKKMWSFEDVFKNHRSRKVMVYYWEKLMSDPIHDALLQMPSREALYAKIFNEFKDQATPADIYKAIGMFEQIQVIGVNGLRAEIEEKHTRQTWYNLRKKMVEFIEKYMGNYDNSLRNIVDNAILTEPKQLNLPHLI